jgi:cytochrome b561
LGTGGIILIGSKMWKFIHYLSFFNFIVALLHGLASGTDTVMPWAQAVYWIQGGTVLFLTVVRTVAGLFPPQSPPKRPTLNSAQPAIPPPSSS